MKEKFCNKTILGGKRAAISENGVSFGMENENSCMENRLVYMAGEGAPAVPGGPVIDIEQARKIVAAAGQVPGLPGVAEAKKALDDYEAVKAREDLEKFKKEFEGKLEEKDKVYSDISKVFKDKVLSLPDSGVADVKSQLQTIVKKEIPDETVISEEVLKALSFDASAGVGIDEARNGISDAVEMAKAKKMLIDIFVEEVALKITNSNLNGKKSFKVKYENKGIVVDLFDQDATTAAKPAEAAESDVAAEEAVKEIKGNQSLMTVLGFFGLVPKGEDGKLDYKAASTDPVVKFVAWLFGAEFAKGAIDPLVKAASAKWPGIGEKIEGVKANLQEYIAPFVPNALEEKVDNLANAIAKKSSDWKNKGLEKKLTVTKESPVSNGDLVVEIPPGKTVDLNQNLTVKFEDGASAPYTKGEKIEGGSEGRIFRLSKGTRISEGATFDVGVKIWIDKKDQEVAEGKASEVTTADKAVEKEAPEEKPAA